MVPGTGQAVFAAQRSPDHPYLVSLPTAGMSTYVLVYVYPYNSLCFPPSTKLLINIFKQYECQEIEVFLPSSTLLIRFGYLEIYSSFKQAQKHISGPSLSSPG